MVELHELQATSAQVAANLDDVVAPDYWTKGQYRIAASSPTVIEEVTDAFVARPFVDGLAYKKGGGGTSMDDQGRNRLTRPLERMAPTGIYLARGVPRDVLRAARARAVREGTTLRGVLLHALLDYAESRWTPRQEEASSGLAVTSS
jgi:hypothetical protein